MNTIPLADSFQESSRIRFRVWRSRAIDGLCYLAALAVVLLVFALVGIAGKFAWGMIMSRFDRPTLLQNPEGQIVAIKEKDGEIIEVLDPRFAPRRVQIGESYNLDYVGMGNE
jgi:hypothetical protein